MKPFEQKTYTEYVKCPEGQHIARLVGLIDMGTQEIVWQGETKLKKKLYLQYEVYPEGEDGQVETDKEGKFFLIGQDFTSNLSDKGKLLPFINSWRGKPLEAADFPFDFSRMLGKYCLMTVVHNKSKDGTKTYANINGISPVPKKLAQNSAGESILPLSSTQAFFFDLDADNWANMTVFFETRLWDGIRGKIMASPEFQARDGIKPKVDEQDENDSIPF
jgi:hypothetical protein